jgi:hypothetical protein
MNNARMGRGDRFRPIAWLLHQLRRLRECWECRADLDARLLELACLLDLLTLLEQLIVKRPLRLRLTARRGSEVQVRGIALRRHATRPWTASPSGHRPAEAGRLATRWQLAKATGLAAALTVFWWLVSPVVSQPPCCDAGQYLRMAADPGVALPRPHSLRVLVPWIVHALGTDLVTTYKVISLACLASALTLTYPLLRRLGVSHRLGLVALAGLACSHGWVFYSYDPFLSDPAAFMLLAAAFLIIVRGRPAWLLALVLVAMSATRELFAGVALPLFAWVRRRDGVWRALAQTATVVVPASIAYALLLAFAPTLPSPEYSRPVAQWPGTVLRTRMEQDGLLWPGGGFAMSLGVWWVLALASWRSREVRPLLWWLVPVFAQLALGWDWARYLLYAFPVVLVAGALAVQHSTRQGWLLVLVAMQAVLPLVDLAAGHVQLNRAGPSLPLSLVLMALTGMVLIWDMRNRRSRRPD